MRKYFLRFGTFRAGGQGNWSRGWWWGISVHGAHDAGTRLAFGAYLKSCDFSGLVKPEGACKFFCPAATASAPCPADTGAGEGDSAGVGVGVDEIMRGGEVGTRPVGCEEVEVGANGVWA